MAAKKHAKKTLACGVAMQAKRDEQNKWEKPTLEDVSNQVMAQPYIRFT